MRKKAGKFKKILLTGSTGFVGSNLAKRLIDEGYEVHCIIRNKSNLKALEDFKRNIIFHKCNLLDKALLNKIIPKIKPQIIIHCANVNIYGGIEADPKTTMDINFLGTVNLIAALEMTNYELFINTGSSSEYGRASRPMKESDICFPESVYGISKLAATLYCRAYSINNKKPIVTLRLFSPFGPNDHPARLINYLITNATNNRSIKIANPKGLRDFIYIDDVIEAYLSCINNNKKIAGEIINIGIGKQTSVEDMTKFVLSYTKSKSKILYGGPKHNYESSVWIADIKKAKKIIRWEPKISVKEGIKKLIETYKPF